jgi:DNA (cytosine-5)-methyltransferase 1
MRQLVLSLFPGIGLLDMAFEEEGFCVVRGPDLLWGGEVKEFEPPAGKFDGVIGGPPCQLFSRFRFINPSVGVHGNLIPDFERIVRAAQPAWFVMENVPDAPEPQVEGYTVRDEILNNRWLGEEQNRLRRFSFGSRSGAKLYVETVTLECARYERAVMSTHEGVPVKIGGNGKVKKSWTPPTVTGGHGASFSHERGNMSIERMCELQGLPLDFLADAPLTAHGKRKVIGNGVPLPMGRAIAKAVQASLKRPE